MNRYTHMAAADSMGKGHTGGGVASDMVNLQMGMALGQQMVNQMNQNQNPGMPNMAAGAAANISGAAQGRNSVPTAERRRVVRNSAGTAADSL